MKPSSRMIQMAQEYTKKNGAPKTHHEEVVLKVKCLTAYLDEEWQAKQPKALVKKP
jgi:hypothetical protein